MYIRNTNKLNMDNRTVKKKQNKLPKGEKTHKILTQQLQYDGTTSNSQAQT